MSTDRLSATFSALADPTRRAILARLALGETSVTEVSPSANRARIARRVGSASAEKVALSESVCILNRSVK